MRTTISNGNLAVTADTRGAELVSVVFEGQEKLWQNESGEWAGHAPVLFPVCGNCAVQINGEEFPVGRHGFARNSEFRLVKQSVSSLCFELKSNDETKSKYPFEFVFRVHYSLSGAKLRIVYEVENPTSANLYFSCGGHESYLLTRPLREYELKFPLKERFESLLHDSEGRLTGETLDFGRGTRFLLPDDFLINGNTIIFKNLRSRRLSLCETGGRKFAEVSFSGFSNLLLWRPGTQNMICIEPWHNLPDGKTKEEFSDKQGIISVPPCAKKRLVREIVYL